jgi:hypothetical protein
VKKKSDEEEGRRVPVGQTEEEERRVPAAQIHQPLGASGGARSLEPPRCRPSAEGVTGLEDVHAALSPRTTH